MCVFTERNVFSRSMFVFMWEEVHWSLSRPREPVMMSNMDVVRESADPSTKH